MGKKREMTKEEREEARNWSRRKREIAMGVTESDSLVAKMIASEMRGGNPGHRVNPAPRLDQLDGDFN